jgi:DNA (cytosine-5)-methyltransferase 1
MVYNSQNSNERLPNMTQTLTNPNIFTTNPTCLSPTNAPLPTKPGVIELFAGAGGLAQGFLQSGFFNLIALTDINNNAKATFQHNHPNVTYIASDIHDLQPKQLLSVANGRRITGLLGGPPCQGFSLAGLKNPEDTRNQHIKDYIRFVKELNPDFLVMENVPQLFFHQLFEYLLQELGPKFYIKYGVLNAAQYGVPQTRHRAFVIAYNQNLGIKPTFPYPTHDFVTRSVYNYARKKLENPGDPKTRLMILGADPIINDKIQTTTSSEAFDLATVSPLLTIWDALSDLCSLEAGCSTKTYLKAPQSDYQKRLRNNATTVANHVSRIHGSEMLKRINLIPAGGDLSDLPKSYWPKSHYSQAYGRLHWQGLSRTLTTYFCNAGSGRFTHPSDARTITVREAARLQGFADSFVFLGSQEEQMKLVGNAVPLPLAQAISHHIYKQIGALISL